MFSRLWNESQLFPRCHTVTNGLHYRASAAWLFSQLARLLHARPSAAPCELQAAGQLLKNRSVWLVRWGAWAKGWGGFVYKAVIGMLFWSEIWLTSVRYKLSRVIFVNDNIYFCSDLQPSIVPVLARKLKLLDQLYPRACIYLASGYLKDHSPPLLCVCPYLY